MPVEILKSHADAVSSNFAGAVENYRQALLTHRYSAPAQSAAPAQEAVPDLPATPKVPARGPNKGIPASPMRPGRPAIPARAEHPGTPRPSSHPLIEAAIKRVQTPGKPDEFVADYKIIDDTPPPPTLEQRKGVLMLEVSKQETTLINRVWPQGKQRLDLLVRTDVLLKDEKERTEKEQQFLDDLTNKQNKVNSIARQAATLQSEIEDLTDENIASWSGKLTE